MQNQHRQMAIALATAKFRNLMENIMYEYARISLTTLKNDLLMIEEVYNEYGDDEIKRQTSHLQQLRDNLHQHYGYTVVERTGTHK